MTDSTNNTQDTGYQGWSNYATWRIQLEVLDAYVDSIAQDGELVFDNTGAFADYLKETTEDMLFGEAADGLVTDYARAFVMDVNWFEIAEHGLDSYPMLLKANVEAAEADAAIERRIKDGSEE